MTKPFAMQWAIAASAVFLLACAAQPTATPTPTPQPTAVRMTCSGLEYQETYSKLDGVLSLVVRKYDDCELSEEEAAAKAHVHYHNAVLVEVEAARDPHTWKPTEMKSGRARTSDWLGRVAIGPVRTHPGKYTVFAWIPVRHISKAARGQDVGLLRAVRPPANPPPYRVHKYESEFKRKVKVGPEFPHWLPGDQTPYGYTPYMPISGLN